MSEIRNCPPGSCFGGESLSGEDRVKEVKQKMKELPNRINLALESPSLKGFVPSFDGDPKSRYDFNHTLLGKTAVEVFEGTLDGRPVEWHMATDKDGRVWIERITFSNSDPSIFGNSKEFIDSGALTNKPLEYNDHSWYLRDIKYNGKPAMSAFGGQYNDITGFLNQLEPIKKYRNVRKKERSKPNTLNGPTHTPREEVPINPN